MVIYEKETETESIRTSALKARQRSHRTKQTLRRIHSHASPLYEPERLPSRNGARIGCHGESRSRMEHRAPGVKKWLKAC